MNSDLAIETVACEDGMFVLRVRGRLDARSAPLLSSRCVELRGQGRRLILNMSGVTFIASSGIGALLAMVEECRHAGT
ncbi:MAG TPA: STAS domain-containing protein, partial [Dongiaceae bacterium]|nr:STAS domain-containing protein [Dongiaceae bacterium]